VRPSTRATRLSHLFSGEQGLAPDAVGRARLLISRFEPRPADAYALAVPSAAPSEAPGQAQVGQVPMAFARTQPPEVICHQILWEYTRASSEHKFILSDGASF
jgi:hypothetical protein